MPSQEVVICPADKLKAAFKCLHQGLSPDQQDALLATLAEQRAENFATLDGVYVALESDNVIAATWIQRSAGSSAILWPPEWQNPAANGLLRAVCRQLEAWRTNLAQMVIASGQFVDEGLLGQHGFNRIAELAYLSLEAKKFPSASSRSRLTFETAEFSDAARLEAVVRATYQQTLDCPELNDLRSPSATLESYRAQGEYDPANWIIASDQERDVGVLILTSHSQAMITELVYMGVVSAARGQGYGAEILAQAIRRASERGSSRLVLAVDVRNLPARAVYERAGFAAWDQRTVYARLAV